MNNTYRHPQDNQGFALITVLVISFLGSLIVFDTIQENLNQERMAGNYSKELNARLQAENGLAEAYNMLSADSTLSTDDMMTQLNSAQNDSGGYHHNIDAWLDSDIREVDSSGFHHEGTYAMRGSINSATSSGNNIFTGAVTTCDGAYIGSGGVIDSYDSNDGAYNSNNPGTKGDITVLSNDSSAQLEFSGSADIYGDLSVNGDISFTNGRVYGNAYASGTITTNNSGEASIGGAIEAIGNVSYNSTDTTNVPDSISSNNDVNIGNTSFDGAVAYGGDDGGNYSSNSLNSTNDVIAYDTDHVKEASTELCDALDLNSEFNNTTDGIATLASSIPTIVNFGSPTTELLLSDSGISAYNQNNGVVGWDDTGAVAETVQFLGEDTSVYALDINNFSYGELTMTVESGSNITIYLSDTTVIGGSIKVEDGASLTIITQDSVTVDYNGSITNVLDLNGDGDYETISDAAVNSNGDIATILYSNYESKNNNDYGISLQGNTDSMLTAYAPNTAVKVQASGNLYGSLRSNYLTVTNTDVGIHYDEQIANANVGSSNGESKVKISRWF